MSDDDDYMSVEAGRPQARIQGRRLAGERRDSRDRHMHAPARKSMARARAQAVRPGPDGGVRGSCRLQLQDAVGLAWGSGHSVRTRSNYPSPSALIAHEEAQAAAP